MVDPTLFGMVNPAIFEDLQIKIDEDSQVREELKNILQVLEKQGNSLPSMKIFLADNVRRSSHSIHSLKGTFYTYSTPYRVFSKTHKSYSDTALVQSTISDAEKSIHQQIETIARLGHVASKYPYYRYNGIWTRDVQNAVSTHIANLNILADPSSSVLVYFFVAGLAVWQMKGTQAKLANS